MGVEAKSPDGFGLAGEADPSGEPPRPDAAPSRWRLDSVVAELRLSREVTHNIRPKGRFRRPTGSPPRCFPPITAGRNWRSNRSTISSARP